MRFRIADLNTAQDHSHPFDTVQVINKSVSIRYEGAWPASHLVVLGHVLQKHARSTAILGSQPIDIGQAWDAIVFPHPESSFFRREGLSKITVNDDLRNAVLFSNADSCYLPAADEVSDGFGREFEDLLLQAFV